MQSQGRRSARTDHEQRFLAPRSAGQVQRGAAAIVTFLAPAGTRSPGLNGQAGSSETTAAMRCRSGPTDRTCPRDPHPQPQAERRLHASEQGSSGKVGQVGIQPQGRAAHRAARSLQAAQRTAVLLGAPTQLHPDEAGEGHDRRRRRTRRCDYAGHSAGARRMGARSSAAQLRRERQRRGALGRGVRRRLARRFTSASVFVRGPEQIFAEPVPCPNGVGQIEVRTIGLPEGTIPLVVRAAGRGEQRWRVALRSQRESTTLLRVESTFSWREAMAGGTGMTSLSAGAIPSKRIGLQSSPLLYKLCAEACTRGEQTGESLTRLGIQVPAPGTWKLSVWRRDSAGNQSDAAESAPVTLRYDPDPPVIGFEAHDPSDPTLVAVEAKDSLSGVADGAIEISACRLERLAAAGSAETRRSAHRPNR